MSAKFLISIVGADIRPGRTPSRVLSHTILW